MSPQMSKLPSKRKTRSHGLINWVTKNLNNAFDDKRVTISLIAVWFVICIAGFGWLGIFKSQYMRFGPSSTLTYMGMVIDTTTRYVFVVVFVILSTAINDFSSDAISPFLQNTVQDHKSMILPYRKTTVLFLAQSWSLYCGPIPPRPTHILDQQMQLSQQ
jgi:hypothetical protein